MCLFDTKNLNLPSKLQKIRFKSLSSFTTYSREIKLHSSTVVLRSWWSSQGWTCDNISRFILDKICILGSYYWYFRVMLSGFVHNVSVNTLSLFLSCQLLTWVFGHHVETDVRQKFQPYHPRPTPDQAAITGVNKAGVNKAEGKILKNLWGRNEKDTSTSLCSLTSCEFVWLRFNKMSPESFFIFTRSFFITKKKYAPHVNHYYSHVRWNYQVRRRWTGEKIRKTFGENTTND